MIIPQPAHDALTTISLFSGGGGLDLGFAAAGFSLRCSTDIDMYSCNTLTLNASRVPFYKSHSVLQANVTTLAPESLIEASDLSGNKVAMLIGGPPCQSFSVFGQRKGLDDPRGNLVWEYVRLLEHIRPSAFVFENVAGLKSINNSTLLPQLIQQLTIRGLYTVTEHHYQMADYGIPQFRERIFLIGSQQPTYIPEMLPTHAETTLRGLAAYVTVADGLRNLPEINNPDAPANHFGRIHSERIIERYTALKPGQRDPTTRINKLHLGRPSYTIIVGSDRGGGKGHVHPTEPRELTPRESARLQTFPDWWEFAGTGRHVIRQVGNAVPPLFAALLAQHIKQYIFGYPQIDAYRTYTERLQLNHLTPEKIAETTKGE